MRMEKFEIPVKTGDEVVFSSVQYMIRTVEITPEIIKKIDLLSRSMRRLML